MLPSQLTSEQFAKYPPQARAVALAHLPLLQKIPLSFLLSLFRELFEYDYKFPVERSLIDRELTYLASLDAAQLAETFAAFAAIRLSPAQEGDRWVTQPMQASEDFSAYLWSTNQMDAFRVAATTYGEKTHVTLAAEPPAMGRLGIAVIGQGASAEDGTLFRQLRRHGTYFTHVDPTNGLEHLLAAVESRAQAHPAPYSHWYVDGGESVAEYRHVTAVSYSSLAAARDKLLEKIQQEVGKPGMGPEELRDYLSRLSPTDLGMRGDPLLDRFQMKVMTEGSGTQIFSTTFAQWTAREVLRRASALTLLVRFAPRQRQRPMNDLLASNKAPLQLDPLGSLVDADMASYYHWINQQRLSGADRSSFLVWYEGHAQAVAIAPTLPRGAESKSSLGLEALVRLVTS